MIIPAIDLRQGKAVRLFQGKAGTEKIYYEDPVEAALKWQNSGAKVIHIVDLDAAMGLGNNVSVIKKIVNAVSIEIQVGGGIRTIEKAAEFISLGVERVVIGTSAVKNPQMVSDLAREFGKKRIIVALDHLNSKIMVKGWLEATSINVYDFAKIIEKKGAGWILFSSVKADGTLRGIDPAEISKMVKTVTIPVIAAGGVKSLEDIRILQKTGVAGVIIGRALYEKKFTLEEALKIVTS